MYYAFHDLVDSSISEYVSSDVVYKIGLHGSCQ